MKLIKALSTITVTLLATFANAKTSDVITADLTKLQPINTAELVQAVEMNLATSMKQIKVTLTANELNTHYLAAEANKTTAAKTSKQLDTKVALIAE